MHFVLCRDAAIEVVLDIRISSGIAKGLRRKQCLVDSTVGKIMRVKPE